MNLILTCLVLLAMNCISIFIYHECAYLKLFFSNFYSNFRYELSSLVGDYNQATNKKLPFSIIRVESSIKEQNIKEPIPLYREKIELNNKLRSLEFILSFEMYLNENKVNRDRFYPIEEFNELKLSTQQGILESTKKLSNLMSA